MERKTLKEMRVMAADFASQHGHRISDWRPDDRSHFCFTSHCKDCHSWIQIKGWKVPAEKAQQAAQAGLLIVQDTHAISSQDHIIAIGAALIISCWAGRPGERSNPPAGDRRVGDNPTPVLKIGIEEEIERLIQRLELDQESLAVQDETTEAP
jgi:hypothetical protein